VTEIHSRRTDIDTFGKIDNVNSNLLARLQPNCTEELKSRDANLSFRVASGHSSMQDSHLVRQVVSSLFLGTLRTVQYVLYSSSNRSRYLIYLFSCQVVHAPHCEGLIAVYDTTLCTTMYSTVGLSMFTTCTW
jgi:hypothetical protein